MEKLETELERKELIKEWILYILKLLGYYFTHLYLMTFFCIIPILIIISNFFEVYVVDENIISLFLLKIFLFIKKLPADIFKIIATVLLVINSVKLWIVKNPVKLFRKPERP